MPVLQQYRGPWKGVDVSMPDVSIDRSASPFIKNFILKNGEIRTRQRYEVILPGVPDGRAIRACAGFLDANSVWHTVALTATGLWQLNGNFQLGMDPAQAWNLIQTFGIPGGTQDLYPVARFVNKLFFCNGYSYLYSWDGISNQVNIETVVAGGLYLAELNAQLILANTIELQAGVLTNFPQRIRWGASGFTNQFDPAVNVGAGFNDSLDCPDNITGLLTIGRVGYIYRTNGITEIFPTGQGTNPWDFNHLWASDKGVGNIFPRTIASYGSVGIFVSEDDIYQLGLQSLQAIGGPARDAIYTDIANASDIIVGTINVRRTPNYLIPTYNLIIPQGNGSIWWEYLIETKSWSRPVFSRYSPTADMNYVPTI